MKRITLDTNIIISILIFNSKELDRLFYHVVLDHYLVLSTYIIVELKMVVQRKFPDKKKVLEEFLKELPFELSYTPKNIDNSLFEIRDKKDYPILYSAIVEEVDNFITGDQDFSSVDINKPEILTPREFLDKYC